MKKLIPGWKLDRQIASVKKFDDVIVVCHNSIGRRGLWIITPPYICIHSNAPMIDIAEAILVALDKSSDIWPPPPHVSEDRPGFLKAAKLRSWKDYDPIASLAIERDKRGGIEITAFMRKGDAHVPVDNVSIRLRPNVVVERLAKAVEKAFSKSEAVYSPKRKKSRK